MSLYSKTLFSIFHSIARRRSEIFGDASPRSNPTIPLARPLPSRHGLNSLNTLLMTLRTRPWSPERPPRDTQTSTSPTARMIRTVEEVITARASKQLTARRIARQVAAGRGTTPNEQPTARQRLPASVLVLQMPSPPRLRTLGEQAR